MILPYVLNVSGIGLGLNDGTSHGYSGNKLGGGLGEVVSPQEQTSPYFQLREKSKCIEYIGKCKFWSKTSPEFSGREK